MTSLNYLFMDIIYYSLKSNLNFKKSKKVFYHPWENVLKYGFNNVVQEVNHREKL